MKMQITVFLILATTLFAYSGNPADELTVPYSRIHRSYIADSTEGVSEAAGQIVAITEKAIAASKNDSEALPHFKSIRDAARKIQSADLKSGREAFKTLSKSLILLSRAAGKDHNVFYCSMAGYWIQQDQKTPANPYMGQSMLTCGAKHDASKVK